MLKDIFSIYSNTLKDQLMRAKPLKLPEKEPILYCNASVEVSDRYPVLPTPP